MSNESPWSVTNVTPRGARRSRSRVSVAGSVGKRSGTPAAEYLRWTDGPGSPGSTSAHGFELSHGTEPDDDELDFEIHDSAMSDREGYEGLENVRACCDGYVFYILPFPMLFLILCLGNTLSDAGTTMTTTTSMCTQMGISTHIFTGQFLNSLAMIQLLNISNRRRAHRLLHSLSVREVVVDLVMGSETSFLALELEDPKLLQFRRKDEVHRYK